jgi:uncharacterized protein
MTVRERIQADVTAAMRARDARRLGALRLITAAFKQREVDTRQGLDDGAVVEILERMLKQRREALAQFAQAGRTDLAAQESFEIALLQEYLPAPLDSDALDAVIGQAVADANATTPKDMGAVMARLREALRGRADMGEVSRRVRVHLGG